MITPELLKQLFPLTSPKLRNRWIPFWNKILPMYGIDSELRVAAFLATVGVESAYLRRTEEYASGWDYDISRNPRKAKELGNLAIGEGPKYKGRGGIQRTGKNNYRRLNQQYGDKIGIDFVNRPDLLEELNHSVHSDCLFWVDNKLNSFADKGKFFEIQGIVNRGAAGKMPLHWNERRELYLRAMRLLPDDFELGEDFEPDVFEAKEVTPENVGDRIDELSELPTGVQPANHSQVDNLNTPAVNPQENANADANATPATPAQPTTVEGTKPSGFIGKLWGGIIGIFTGAVAIPSFVQSWLENGSAKDIFIAVFSAVAGIVKDNFAVILSAVIGGLVVYYVTKKVNNYYLTKLKVEKNVQIITPEVQPSAVRSFLGL